MILRTKIQRFASFFLLFLFAGFSSPARQQEAQQREVQQKEELRGAPAEPDDAAEVRAQIAVVENSFPLSSIVARRSIFWLPRNSISESRAKHSIF